MENILKLLILFFNNFLKKINYYYINYIYLNFIIFKYIYLNKINFINN